MCLGTKWEGAGKEEPQVPGHWDRAGHQGCASSGCHQRAEKCFLRIFSREGASAA